MATTSYPHSRIDAASVPSPAPTSSTRAGGPGNAARTYATTSGSGTERSRPAAEDRLGELRLTRQVQRVGGARRRLGHAGGLEQLGPFGVPAVQRGGVDLRMELHGKGP